MLQLYYTGCGEVDEAGECSLFSDYSREKLSQLRSPTLRKQMIAAELLLMRGMRRTGYSAEFPLHILTNQFGKPYIPDSAVHFSISHSGERVCCALSDHEIGLDVQEIVEPREAMLRRCFSEREQQFVRESDRPAAVFTRLWCLKESYVKATGLGLSHRLDSLALDLTEPVSLPSDARARFWVWEDAGFQTALCTLDGCDPKPEQIEYIEFGW